MRPVSESIGIQLNDCRAIARLNGIANKDRLLRIGHIQKLHEAVTHARHRNRERRRQSGRAVIECDAVVHL